MPEFKTATTFEVLSVDHDAVLLSDNVHTTRHLLSDKETTPPKEIKVSFTVDGQQKSSSLFREKIVQEKDFAVTLASTGEQSTVDYGDHYAYYSKDKNWVLSFTNEKNFEGLVFEKGNSVIHNIVVKSGVMKVDDKVRSYFPGPMRSLTEEVAEEKSIEYWDDCYGGQKRGESSQLNTGIAVGYEFLKAEGRGGWYDIVNNYFILANAIYERQMDVRLIFKGAFLAEVPQSFSPAGCTLSTSDQLTKFKDWKSRPNKQPVWHLVDSCYGVEDASLGVAYLGTACGSSSNVGFTNYYDDFFPAGDYQSWATFVHEIGHNLDAEHTWEDGQGKTGGIMDYGPIVSKQIDGVSQFNTKYRKKQVCAKLNSMSKSSSCLRTPSFFTASEEVEDVEEKLVDRDLSCFKHSRRTVNGREMKTIFSATKVGCKSECEVTAKCKGFLLNDEGYCVLIEETKAEDLTYSKEFDTYFCSEGKLRESLKEESIDDLLEKLDANDLKKECCVEEENQTYLGMNYFYRETLTQVGCELRCVKDSKCEVSSFNKENNECLFYGGDEFTKNEIFSSGVQSMSCDRSCLETSALTFNENVSSSENVGGTIAAVFFGVVAIVAFVGSAIAYKKKKSVKVVEDEGALNLHTL